MLLQHSKIKFKILFSLLLAIIPFIIFIFVLFDLWYDTRRELVIKENLTVAAIMADAVNAYFTTGIDIANILSQKELNNLFKKADILDKPEEIHLILKSVNNQLPLLSSITLVNPQGKIIASSIPFSEIESDFSVSDRGYFQRTLNTGKMQSSDVLTGRITGKTIIMTSSPVFEDNQIASVVLAATDLNELQKNLKSLLPESSGKNSDIYLVNKSGKVIFSLLKDLPEGESIDLSTLPAIQLAATGKEAVIDGSKLPNSNVTVLGAAVPVKRSNRDNIEWILVSVTASENIFLPVIRAQSFLWILILISTLFALTLISLVLRKIKIIY